MAIPLHQQTNYTAKVGNLFDITTKFHYKNSTAMKSLQTEVLDTIAKYNGIELPDMNEADVRDLCAALREYADWQADSIKAYEEEIVPELKAATEGLTDQLKLAEELKKQKEDADYWQKAWSEVYGKYNELKSQLTALSTIIAALTK